MIAAAMATRPKNGKQSDSTLHLELRQLRCCTLDEGKSGKQHKVGQLGHHNALN